MKNVSNDLTSSRPTITIDYDSTISENSALTLTSDDVVLLEKAISELYISQLLPNLSRKLIRKICIKINGWRGSLISPTSCVDFSINKVEMSYILSSIQIFIYIIPLTFIAERISAHAMLKRFTAMDYSGALTA